MGVVYRAVQPRLERRVALKVIKPEVAGDETFRRRFEREWHTAAAIDHPNILPVYEAGDAEDTLFIAMRYVERDLRSMIHADEPLSVERAMHILAQVASALDGAHEEGLLHRDVKPANILVDPRRSGRPFDHAYLADFGLAREARQSSGQMTAAGTFVGTPDYAAPEQIEAKELDGRVDVYALAIVLFECLTLKTPYERDSEWATIYAHLYEPPPSLSAIRPDLPAGLDDVFAAGLAKNRDERFATAGDLLHAARSVLGYPSGELPTPPYDPDAGPGDRPSPWPKTPLPTETESQDDLVPPTAQPRPAERRSETSVAASAPATPPAAPPPAPTEAGPVAAAEAQSLPTRAAPAPSITETAALPEEPPTVAEGSATVNAAEPVASPAQYTALAAAADGSQVAEPAPAGTPRGRSRRGGLIGAIAVAVFAGALGAGYALGGSGEGQTPEPALPFVILPETVQAAHGTFSVPAGWAQTAGPEIPGLTLADPVSYGPGDGAASSIVFGEVDGVAPTFLPESFLDLLPAEVVEGRSVALLGETAAVHLVDVQPSGFEGSLELFAVPTTGSSLVLACYSAADEPLDECRSIASTFRPTDVTVVPLGAPADYADLLNGTFRALEQARLAAMQALAGAQSATAQATAVNRVANAYRSAADALVGIEVAESVQAAHQTLQGALETLANDYEALARHAERQAGRRYNAVREQISVEVATLTAAIDSLAGLGFTVVP
jgi:serine/threonine-protein kinase